MIGVLWKKWQWQEGYFRGAVKWLIVNFRDNKNNAFILEYLCMNVASHGKMLLPSPT
jgi:hypothetical protein